MKRRRLLWLCIPLIVMSGIVAAWFWMSQRDADFVVIGPKTKGMRANFALLDTRIDPADYRDCKTVRQAIERLNEKLPTRMGMNGELACIVEFMFERKALDVAFELPPSPAPITVKQFIRIAYSQSDLPEVAVIVRGHYIEVTTAKQAQGERTRYRDSVSIYDRMHHFWKEMTGTVEPDEPEWFILDVR